MTVPPSKRSLAAPFADRELNGEILLREVASLREARVRQSQLNDCVVELKELPGLRVSETIAKIRELAGGRFQADPALAGLLVRWAAKLRSEQDVGELVSHFERLAITSALISAIRRGAERLPAAPGSKK